MAGKKEKSQEREGLLSSYGNAGLDLTSINPKDDLSGTEESTDLLKDAEIERQVIELEGHKLEQQRKQDQLRTQKREKAQQHKIKDRSVLYEQLQEEYEDEQTIVSNTEDAPIAIDGIKTVTAYDKDTAEKESNKLVAIIAEKIEGGDKTPTAITNLSEHSHVVRNLQKQNIKVNVSFQGELSEILAHVNDSSLSSEQKNEIIKEFITDISNANEINFTSQESIDEFKTYARDLGLNISNIDIKVNDNSLSEQQGEEQQGEEQQAQEQQGQEQESQGERDLNDLTSPLNEDNKSTTSTQRQEEQERLKTKKSQKQSNGLTP